MNDELRIRAQLQLLVDTGLIPSTTPDRVCSCWKDAKWKDGRVQAGKWYSVKRGMYEYE